MADPASNTPRTAWKAKKKKRSGGMPAAQLARAAVDAMLAKKARDISVLDLRGVNGVSDFFVIGTGDSELQIKAIADGVLDQLRDHCDEKPWHREGYEHKQWVLLDYVDLVVHVFNQQRREFYDLERLWGDAEIERVPDEASGDDVKILN